MQNKGWLVSVDMGVCVTNFNYDCYIDQCLASTRCSDIRARVVVVDDFSDPDKRGYADRVLQRYGAVTLFLPSNRGLGVARNIGTAYLNAEWTLMLDADDWLCNHALDYLAEAVAEHPKAGIIYGDYWRVGEGTEQKHYTTLPFTKEVLGRTNPTTSFILLSREAFHATGGYTSARYSEDWDFDLRAFERGVSAVHIDRDLFFCRYHKDSKWMRDMAQGSEGKVRTEFAKRFPKIFAGVAPPPPAPAAVKSAPLLAACVKDLKVWSYWEGEKAEWLTLCESTLRKWVQPLRLVVLDRAAFQQMRQYEQLLDIDRLAVAQRSDYVRAYLLKYFGGVWIDLDCIALQPLSLLMNHLENNEVVGFREAPHFQVASGMIGSRAGGKVAELAYRKQCDLIREGTKLGWYTLAGQFDSAVQQLNGNGGASLLGSEIIMPIPWNEQERFFQQGAPLEHKAKVNPKAITYMLAGEALRKYEKEHPKADLLHRDSFFRYLIQESLGN